jgi:hypothetical protein
MAEPDAQPQTPTGPETVTEAVQYLAARGYADSFALAAEGLSGPGDDQLHALHEAVVDYQFRFEGESDPGDEAIVLGITCSCDLRGVLVSAFGPSADPQHAAILRGLVQHSR